MHVPGVEADWEVGADVHEPPMQFGVLALHATALPHWPHALHVCTPLLEHWLAFGTHTGVDGQEQAPHAQLELHVCIPYVLHDCVAVGTHP